MFSLLTQPSTRLGGPHVSLDAPPLRGRYGHIPFLYLPFNALIGMNVEKESTQGYQRSTKIAGFPGFEEWNRNGSSTAVALLGDRFIVKAEARGRAEGAARKVLEGMDLSGLAKKGT